MTGLQTLRKVRKERGLSQEAFGKELGKAVGKDKGFTGVTVSRWENGDTAPHRRYLPKISEFTGVPIAALMGMDEPAEAAE